MTGRINRFLGCGRLSELFLALVAITWGLLIVTCSPIGVLGISPNIVGSFAFGVGTLMFLGSIFSFAGFQRGRRLRMLAAMLSIFLWIVMAQISGFNGPAFPWCFWSVLVCARLFYLASINMPRPDTWTQIP
jgi:hypothetical protein